MKHHFAIARFDKSIILYYNEKACGYLQQESSEGMDIGMEVFQTVVLLKSSLALLGIAAVIALIASGKQKFCNLSVNMICIVSSILMMAASGSIILSENQFVKIHIFDTAIPFLSLELAVDGLSALFLLILSILVFCISVYSIGYISHYFGKRNVGLFYFLYSTFILSMALVFTSSNAVFFYISWEAMSVLSYFLVIFESEIEKNQKAGILYIVMTHIGTAFLLIGFMISYSFTGSFDITGSSQAIPEGAKNIIFILYLLGFCTKAGAIPVHIWLPYAHPAAPSNISALMSGVMIKTAIYGLVRFVMEFLGVQHTWWGVLIIVIGVLSAFLGVAYALMEHDMKRLLAYHSVENIGIILIGLGISFISFNGGNTITGSMALTASLLHTLNHALFKGGLFLGAGSIHYATHTKDIEKLGGLIRTMPVTALFVLCFSLAISAIIPFNGFVSEWLTFLSIFTYVASGQAGINIILIIAVATLGMAGALAAACFVKFFGISFLGLPRTNQAAEAREVSAPMNIAMGIIAGICLLIGLLPMQAIRTIDKVTFSLTGASSVTQLGQGFIDPWISLDNTGSSISPAEIFAALAVVSLLTLIAVRIIGGKYLERRYGSWDCGFEALNPRMQYTATGFSKPIKIVFRILFRPSRKTELKGGSRYQPDEIEYTTTSESIFEKYAYRPAFQQIITFSRRAKFFVQTGKIHNYLIYIFVAVLALMAYNRFV